MEELVAEATVNLALATMTNGEPILDVDEERAEILDCEHCGHDPCGCGG